MIDKQVALEIAERYLASHRGGLPPEDELVLLPHLTIERPWGWVFFYTSRLSRDTGDPKYLIAGNAPLIVSRVDGAVTVTGTALPIEHYMHEYEAALEHAHVTWELHVLDAPNPKVLSALRHAFHVPVHQLRALADRVPGLVAAGARVELQPIHDSLKAAGVSVILKTPRAPGAAPNMPLQPTVTRAPLRAGTRAAPSRQRLNAGR